MSAVMLASEAIEDGLGGAFVLDVFARRTAITHRHSRGRTRAIGSIYGPTSRELAMVLVGALVEQLKRRAASGGSKERSHRAVSSDLSESR